MTVLESFTSENGIQKKRQLCLKSFHSLIFKQKADLDTMNRVTYFKEAKIYPFKIKFLKGFPWIRLYIGWGNFLIIDTRTGRYTESGTKWRIDKNKPENNRGVAGISWYKHKTIKLEGLPDIEKGIDLEKYASLCYMDTEEIGRINIKSRSYMGIPIEDENGYRSGVIIIDSVCERMPKCLDNNKIQGLAGTMMYIG